MQPAFRSRAIGMLLVILFLLNYSYWNPWTPSNPKGSPGSQCSNAVVESGSNNTRRRIAKVSMLYGSPNPLYERALKSHERHAQRWGYPMKVLQRDIMGGYWNKPSYLLSLLLLELAKAPSEQVEWLMFVLSLRAILNVLTS
jgi:hypothetical protein